MRENDKRIAEWAGLDYSYYAAHMDEIPKYTTSDADAITLLPTLKERKYWVVLQDWDDEWKCEIGRVVCDYEPYFNHVTGLGMSISEAITSAILQLIDV